MLPNRRSIIIICKKHRSLTGGVCFFALCAFFRISVAGALVSDYLYALLPHKAVLEPYLAAVAQCAEYMHVAERVKIHRVGAPAVAPYHGHLFAAGKHKVSHQKIQTFSLPFFRPLGLKTKFCCAIIIAEADKISKCGYILCIMCYGLRAIFLLRRRLFSCSDARRGSFAGSVVPPLPERFEK